MFGLGWLDILILVLILLALLWRFSSFRGMPSADSRCANPTVTQVPTHPFAVESGSSIGSSTGGAPQNTSRRSSKTP